MNRLQKKYQHDVVPALRKEFKPESDLALPRLKKIVVNMGVSDPQEPRARKKVLENISEQFKIITGQKPQITLAKKSIANFKLREGDPLGLMVTLRHQNMWEFLDKLIATALPREKDFQGVSRTAFDGAGNYSLGISEQIVFPEIDYDKIERVRSMQVSIITTSKSDKQVYKLLELLGMPFAKEE